MLIDEEAHHQHQADSNGWSNLIDPAHDAEETHGWCADGTDDLMVLILMILMLSWLPYLINLINLMKTQWQSNENLMKTNGIQWNSTGIH